jgi:hypothetical protein
MLNESERYRVTTHGLILIFEVTVTSNRKLDFDNLNNKIISPQNYALSWMDIVLRLFANHLPGKEKGTSEMGGFFYQNWATGIYLAFLC